MKEYFERALSNIIKHGDTDIFPYPIENRIFFDKKKETVQLLLGMDKDFEENLTRFPPANNNALAPVGYTGFRWATQIDPIWNAYFLGVVISISEEIEQARIPKAENSVFSYRLAEDAKSPDLFDENYHWRSFMERSLELAKEYKFVVVCDISEFYPRLGHHRLENALKRLQLRGDQPNKIMKFLRHFSDTNSYGIPIGGPASRILSELLLNQMDRLLKSASIRFCRFADDFHLFANNYEDAFSALLFLSEKLLNIEGLQLQKSKTRIMSGQEFIATSPLSIAKPNEEISPETPAREAKEEGTARSLLSFAIKFDPYSATAQEDYELLRREIQKYDIISLLKSELAKSRIHISLSKKIVSAIRYIDDEQKDDAVLSLITNSELLYPIYANVLVVAKTLFDGLGKTTQERIIEHTVQLIRERSHVLQPDLNLAYAIRLIASSEGSDKEEVLSHVYSGTQSYLLRTDIILTMARWRASYWLSDLRTRFRMLGPSERRAFIIASYVMTDEGEHWRDLRWSRFPGQFGGKAKMDSGFDYAASFSSFSCIA